MTQAGCAGLSAAAAEPLAGTATPIAALVLLEVRRGWGRDALEDTELPAGTRERLVAWTAATPGSRVLLVRRPDRRAGPLRLISAHLGEHATAVETELERLEQVADLDLDAPGGEPVRAPFFLVCAHGRRDRCCARLGVPVYDALRAAAGPERVWQSSHHGGHRFAGNVLVVPTGLQLGRVGPEDAAELVATVDAGRVPVGRLRGRLSLPQDAQAAEAHVRLALGLVRETDVRFAGRDGDTLSFDTVAGPVAVAVEERPGPPLPPSCGDEPKPSRSLVARIVSGPGA